MLVLLGVATLASLIVSGVLGIRLLRLWSRTRQLPELAIGMSFLAAGVLTPRGPSMVSRQYTPSIWGLRYDQPRPPRFPSALRGPIRVLRRPRTGRDGASLVGPL